MPTHLGIVYEDRKYPFGSSMNNQIAARCESLCIKFLLAHGYKLRHKDLIQEYRRLGTDANTDILDAWKMFLLFDAEMEEVKKYAVPSYSTHKIRTFYRDQATGRMLYKDVESQILNR